MPRHVLAALLLAFAAPVLAQRAAVPPQPDSEETTITVTGNRDVGKTVREFVQALKPPAGATQLAKFEQPVCPVVFGVADEQKALVRNRMRKVAAAITRETVKENCEPNVLLAVTSDKPAFMAQLREAKGDYFGDLDNSAIRKLVSDPQPVTAWQVRGPDLNSRGEIISSAKAGEFAVNRTTTPDSRLTAAARPQFAFAVVVVDASVLDGLSTNQLADYAIMRAIANLDPSKIDPKTPSILTIVDAPADAEVPVSLTEWDFALLSGLYKAPNNLYAGAQRSAVASEIKKQVLDDKKGR